MEYHRITPALLFCILCYCGCTIDTSSNPISSGRIPAPKDSTLTVDLLVADSLIGIREYAQARQILDTLLNSIDSVSQYLSARTQLMWCRATISSRKSYDTAHVMHLLHTLPLTHTPTDSLLMGIQALSLGEYHRRLGSDSTKYYFERSIALITGYYEEGSALLQRYFREYGAYYYFDADLLYEPLKLWEKEKLLHDKYLYPAYDQFYNAYYLGAIYRAMENYELAEQCQLRAIVSMRDAHLDTTRMAVLPYASLCYLYASTNNAARLNTYADTTFMLLDRFYLLDTADFLDYHANLGICYSLGEQLDRQRGLQCIADVPPFSGQNIYASAYADLFRAKAYLLQKMGKKADAIEAMQDALALFERRPLDNYYDDSYYDALLGLGVFYLEDGKRVAEAMPYLEKSAMRAFERPLHDVAMRYPVRYMKYFSRWYDYLVGYGDYLLSRCMEGIDDNSPSDVHAHVAGNSSDVTALLLLCERIDSAIATTRQKVTEYDVMRNAQLNHDIYIYMIDWLYELYTTSQDPEVLARTFEYMEKSRAFLLLSQLSIGSLGEQYHIPGEVMDEGIELTREEITTYALLDTADIDALLARKQAYFNKLEKTYPEFYEQSYKPRYATLLETREALTQDEAFISYQLHDSLLFTLIVTTDTALLLRAQFNASCISAVSELNKTISVRPGRGWDSDDVAQFISLSHTAALCVLGDGYQVLAQKRHWWIAADGEIALVPFEILLPGSTVAYNTYDSLPYAVLDHDIGNVLSASTWHRERLLPSTSSQSISAFVHSKGSVVLTSEMGQTTAYQGMPGTARAAEHLRKIYGSARARVYSNSNATRAALLDALTKDNVVHLGLHAFADTTGRQAHGIVFPGDKAVLHIPDLVGHHVKTDLVFLEGCDTGVGKQMRGEGLLNLARPFIAAGAHHVLASRWELNAETASEIAGYFYTELHSGMDIAAANSEAKRVFLLNTRRLQSHPYYWAAVMSVQ